MSTTAQPTCGGMHCYCSGDTAGNVRCCRCGAILSAPTQMQLKEQIEGLLAAEGNCGLAISHGWQCVLITKIRRLLAEAR